MSAPPPAKSWFDSYEVPLDQSLQAAIGPLTLSVTHLAGEWRVGWKQEDEAASETTRVDIAAAEEELPENFTVQRFLTRNESSQVRLEARLADRPVVARPEVPLTVPAGDEATIFVSTPIWVVVVLSAPDRMLLEVPTSRPSDTWFGPDTRRGMIAYASRTAARRHIDNLPPLPHRAITAVTIRNQAASSLPLERLSVPAPNLSLFADAVGGLWTNPLLAVRESESAPARVELTSELPGEVDQPVRVAEPREIHERNVLSRAMQVLLG